MKRLKAGKKVNALPIRAQELIKLVVPEYKSLDKKKYMPKRLLDLASSRCVIRGCGDAITCRRCGGSGRFSWNPLHLDMCYGCGGAGYTVPVISPEILRRAKQLAWSNIDWKKEQEKWVQRLDLETKEREQLAKKEKATKELNEALKRIKAKAVNKVYSMNKSQFDWLLERLKVSDTIEKNTSISPSWLVFKSFTLQTRADNGKFKLEFR